MTLGLAFLIGFLNGARTFLAPALVAWSAAFGWLDIAGTGLGWLGAPAPAAILTLLALGELYGDKRPEAPNRTISYGLAGRIVMGALSGAAIAMGAVDPASGWAGAGLGALGAAIGTFATLRARLWLAAKFGKDLPAALAEDALLIAAIALLILAA
ncbi:MAG: DUF4126 domain-containing protein [Sphingomonas sp.]|nr:DUF4126 domain-containing protein [Sphingomonas sp.]RZV48929.1 MAG: DUF4126 domain-containing protein [Sphingomonadaceae bacterium]